MARFYDTRQILDGGQAKSDDWNAEIAASLSEINGQLDQHQLPLNSFTDTKLVQPTVSTQYINYDGTYSTYMATQSYHQSEWLGDDITMLYDDNLYNGFYWIKLQDLQVQALGITTGTGGAQLSFTGQEGMISGCAVIDWNWFTGEAQVSVGDPPSNSKKLYGRDSVIEWGVFVDDVLVSKSGFIWPKRLTLNLPFNCPAPSKPVRVDVRFRIQFIDPNAAAGPGTASQSTIDANQSFKLIGAILWSRNEYR
jgi:hypothetical protein